MCCPGGRTLWQSSERIVPAHTGEPSESRISSMHFLHHTQVPTRRYGRRSPGSFQKMERPGFGGKSPDDFHLDQSSSRVHKSTNSVRVQPRLGPTTEKVSRWDWRLLSRIRWIPPRAIHTFGCVKQSSPPILGSNVFECILVVSINQQIYVRHYHPRRSIDLRSGSR